MGRYFTRRRFLAATAATGIAAGGVGLYTWRIEPHWLQVVRRKMIVNHLPRSLVGATLAHLSDLHIGPRVDDSYLLNVFDLVNELSPAIVVYTGDFICYSDDFAAHAGRMIPRLPRGTLGTVGILGNHDYGIGWHDTTVADVVVSLAAESGIRILRNERAEISGLKILGMDDLWAGRCDPAGALSELDSESPAIALVHNPDAVDNDGWQNFAGWILAGHTHGGQCKPPFLPPPLLPVRNRRYTSGEFALSGNRQMYISRGVGHLMQVRFNVRPEVTLFELVRGTGHEA